jgi:predicted TIM-barrel fold metal-dependent hydrolase
MAVRMIDPWVNVSMGGPAPDWLIRVKEDYFRAGDEFTQDISEEKLLADMDEAGVAKAILSIGAKSPEPRVLAFAEHHPERFAYAVSVDPRKLLRELWRLEELTRTQPVVMARVVPFLIDLPPTHASYYPLYAKCVELDIPMCVNGGIVGPRMPSWPQQVFRFDEVCYDFPDLTIVMMHGGEPWEDLAVKLMLKWPGLHYMTSAFAPKHYPKAIIDYANTRGADKIMFCGYFPAGLTLERQFADMPNVPFRDHVWPKFLRENALRVFKIPDAIQRATGRPFDA